jgi:uncharacterized membrane protein YbhN (UPF0104 family)
MRRSLLIHAVVAAVLAVALVALPMGIVLVTVPLALVVAIASRLEAKRGHGMATFATYVLTVAIVVAAAIAAPVKTRDEILSRRLVLPKQELTLKEIDRNASPQASEWLPPYVRVHVDEEDLGRQLHFPSTHMTLHQFLTAVEAQTELRHRFLHCVLSSSILYGADCCGGVVLRRPWETEPSNAADSR